MNDGKFGNNTCWCDFPSTSFYFEERGYLLFTGISSPSFSCKTLDPNYWYHFTSFLVNSTSIKTNIADLDFMKFCRFMQLN